MIIKSKYNGYVLSITVMFMVVSLGITFRYFSWIKNKNLNLLRNIASTQAAYNAETGLAEKLYPIIFNDQLDDTTLLGQYEVRSPSGKKFGYYKDPFIRFDNVGNRLAFATGYSDFSDYALESKKQVYIQLEEESFGEYMYFTNKDSAGGAPAVFGGPGGASNGPNERRDVCFGIADAAQGIVQSNTSVVMCNSGCPDFSEVTYRHTAGTGLALGACNGLNDLLGYDYQDENRYVEDFCPLEYPPSGMWRAREHASFTYDSGYKIGVGLKDTLIMTEIEFFPTGFFNVTQWWYLMPPHLKPGITFQEQILPGPEQLDGIVIGPNQNLYYDDDGNGSYSAGDDLETCDEIFECNVYQDSLESYHARYIDNNDNEQYLDTYNKIRGQVGLQHFDFPKTYFDQDGNEISTILLEETRYKQLGVIYIKDGPVRVKGQYKGRFTIVTDEKTPYRRHSGGGLLAVKDTIYNSIWIVDDLIKADAIGTPGYDGNLINMQASENCEEVVSFNSMGLLSGANVIIANTRANGARGCTAGGCNITINAGIIAGNESFALHYWQNSTSSAGTGYPNSGDAPIADGRGLKRFNNSNIQNNDNRGTINFWGSLVQDYRGYVARNPDSQYGMQARIEMAKNYNFDRNYKCNETKPPYYPGTKCKGDKEVNATIVKIKLNASEMPNSQGELTEELFYQTDYILTPTDYDGIYND